MDLVDYATIQRRLHKLGFNPGSVDGIKGRQTINAIQAFQASVGIIADGIVGPATFQFLFGAPAAGEAPIYDKIPWFQEAIRFVGLQEVPGKEVNISIISMAKKFNIDYDDDDIPWCGLFVAFCLGSSLPKEALPNYPLRAQSWAKLGIEEPAQLGSIMVFWRESENSGKGHVGFYFGEDEEAYHILGGNQSNMVNVTRISKKRFLNSRWPLSAMPPMRITSFAASVGGGSLSSSEA